LAEVLSSHWSITYTMGQHYAGVWVGEMLVVYALTLSRFARERSPRFATRLAVASLAICALNLSLASPTHWRHYLAPLNAHDRVIDAFIASLPPDAPVGTHDEIYSHLGFDPNARNEWATHPEYILVDDTYPSPGWQDIGRKGLADLVARHVYTLLRSEDGVELYRRTRPLSDVRWQLLAEEAHQFGERFFGPLLRQQMAAIQRHAGDIGGFFAPGGGDVVELPDDALRAPER
jgi:hypothetical protein